MPVRREETSEALVVPALRSFTHHMVAEFAIVAQKLLDIRMRWWR